MSLDRQGSESRPLKPPILTLSHALLIIFAIPWVNLVSSSPHIQVQEASDLLPPTVLPRIAPKATIPLSLSATSSARSSTPLSLVTPSRNYPCYDARYRTFPINIETCRKTLGILRQFPHYRNMQEFKEGRLPSLPGGITPPFLIGAEDTTCEVVIEARLAGIVEEFSFEQARTLATSIIEECSSEGNPGYGGESPIGRKLEGWVVRAKGSGVDTNFNSTHLLGALRADKVPLVSKAILTSRSSIEEAGARNRLEGK